MAQLELTVRCKSAAPVHGRGEDGGKREVGGKRKKLKGGISFVGEPKVKNPPRGTKSVCGLAKAVWPGGEMIVIVKETPVFYR